MSLSFRRVALKDAELLLQWRTAPEISRHMYTDILDPSIDNQRAWIESLATRKDYRAYMIIDEQSPVGFLCFSDINFDHFHCSTGSYIYPRHARLKYALTLHTYVCNYAFECLGMNKIVNYILGANDKVIKLQKLHRSRLVGVLEQHVYKYGQFHDVHIFEQLRDNWKQQKQHFPLATIKAAFTDWNEHDR